ncbi:MAG: RsmG family class I SAM-dependent methyltransferase, partial [Ferruginibacter sp.]
NISTQHSRAESLPQNQYDVLVTRAVAPLKELWIWSKPLIKKNKKIQAEVPNGLICLKGGDLSQEIFDSGCKPFVWEIGKTFHEPYFKEKFLLYQPR